MLCYVRLWSIGALGAALTIAAIAVEPCLQQIPTYLAQQVTSGSATIARSSNYSNIDQATGFEGFALGKALKGATYLGVFGDEETTRYEPSCPTGNCTWPTYSTLGVCSACQDLSPFLGWGTDGSWKVDWPSQNNSKLQSTGTDAETYSKEYVVYMDTQATPPCTMFPDVLNHTIVDVVSMYWPSDSYNEDPPSAVFECILYYCVKTIDGAAINGEYSETVVSTWPAPNQTLPNEPDSDLAEGISYLNGMIADIRRQGNFTVTPPHSKEVYSVDRVIFDHLRQWTFYVSKGTVDSSYIIASASTELADDDCAAD